MFHKHSKDACQLDCCFNKYLREFMKSTSDLRMQLSSKVLNQHRRTWVNNLQTPKEVWIYFGSLF